MTSDAPDGQRERLLVVSLFRLRDNLLTAIETVRRYAMAKMRFTSSRVNRQRLTFELVVRTAHAAR